MGIFRKGSNEPTLRHLLTVSDERGVQTFLLDASMYSIGRDPSNAIVVHGDSVSRQHAILLRTPTPDKQYSYIIQDGNLEGKPSANGILVNGVPVKKHVLRDGDEVSLGGRVFLIYRTPMLGDQEVEDKVKYPEYRKLKGNVLSTEQTIEAVLEEAEPTKVNRPHTSSALQKEIQVFRDCYDAVIEELRDLHLSKAEYTTIAVAIYQKLKS
ncbi:MAG: FHA domain-containing protein [Pseudanabaenaceae cyanobacterium SKYGB_i_bin29]|nr:FHA domain-containing protein [Pseudanabaenaceae cyanobacterium SKYG29]MDW8421867.1 FHA domain-containing protein [Pseudanabaenaceae cyanobacterium SKYGB_i_bin29]